MTDRTPLILAALDDLLRERVESHPDDADLLALADGVALTVDHGEAARLWPPTGDDQVSAEAVVWAIASEERHAVTGTTPIRIAVARRLADVAASLLVRGDVMQREAEALWGAASRLLGLARVKLGRDAARDLEVAQRDARLANECRLRREAEIHDMQVEIRNQERLVADVTRMMHDKDALIARLNDDLAQARKSVDAASPPKVDLRKHGGNGSAKVRLTAGLPPFTMAQVGMLGRVLAVNNNDGRWHVQLDSGFGAWVDSDAVEVLP
jgi:hypothetical protein